jgi:hypothetical protein
MTVTPVFGEFLGPAGDHITAAVSFRGELPYDAQCGVVWQLDRLVATLARYLADPSDEPGLARGPERNAATRNAAARLALGRAGLSLHQAAAGMADADADRVHPVVDHLSAAADYLAAGRDLLQTHFSVDPAGARTSTSYWAPVITSGPVAAALLAELASYAQSLAPWIAGQSGARRIGLGKLTSAQLALRGAEPWLQLAGTAIEAAQRAHYPLPARSLLAAIPANAPPPRQPPVPGEPVRELCERIPLTAERLRYAAFALTACDRWPIATSASWRRDALASAITSHSGEFILRLLAERAAQLGLQADLQPQLYTADYAMTRAWKSWRAVADQWDIVTTGHPRGAHPTPVATEIGDLALRTGRLAYRNPHWTPAYGNASLIRDLADLADSPGEIVTVVAAVHHAADAISRIAAADHAAVLDAAVGNRLYVPTRLLPENYDIPHPYAPAPRGYADALLAAYDTAIDATTHITTALDNIATAIDASSRVLAAARQAARPIGHDQRRRQDQRPVSRQHALAPLPGRTEQALAKLKIRDPALLLRAAVIDQAAHDLIAQAKAAAHSRDIVAGPASRPSSAIRHDSDRPARVASQDMGTARAAQLIQPHSATVASGASPSRGHPATPERSGRLTP